MEKKKNGYFELKCVEHLNYLFIMTTYLSTVTHYSCLGLLNQNDKYN